MTYAEECNDIRIRLSKLTAEDRAGMIAFLQGMAWRDQAQRSEHKAEPTLRDAITDLQRASYRNLTDILDRLGVAMPKDGTEPMEAPFPLFISETKDLPAAADWEGCLVYSTDLKSLMFSNGKRWVRSK